MFTNRIRLIEDYDNNELVFNFLNGSIRMRSDEYGAYAMCPGCGAGKTTIIKQLIAMRWYEGILYTAFTRDEVDAMYKYVVENLVGSATNPYTGEVLKLDDVIVLHSNYSADGTDRDLWINKPQELANKKVILCTHHKLLNEPIRLLMDLNFDPLAHLNGVLFEPDYACLTSTKGKLPRQWVLIDESTEANPLTFMINKAFLYNLGKKVTYKNVIQTDPRTGKLEGVKIPVKPHFERIYNIYPEFENKVKEISEDFPNMSVLYPDNTELNHVRNGQIIRSLFEKTEELGDKYIMDKSKVNVEFVKLNYSFTNNIFPNMTYRMILFDGTSDITLSNSSKFKLLNYNNKYNSPVTMSYLPFNMERRFKFISGIEPDLQVRTAVKKLAQDIKDIIVNNNYQKTLIFTWKDLKSRTEEIDDSKDKDFNLDNRLANPQANIKLAKEFNRTAVNPNQGFYKYLETEVLNLGISPDKFSIEYYGSGKDKATNEFKDYDAVILAGKYQVPNSVIAEYNSMYGTNIGAAEYYTNRLIQAICRTRIRRHDRSSIGIHISSDWSVDTIQMTKRYLGLIQINSGIQFNQSVTNVANQLMTKGITPKKAEQIAKLSTLDCNIANSILLGNPYSCQLKLDDVFKILPMSKRESGRYSFLIESLVNLGINISISS